MLYDFYQETTDVEAVFKPRRIGAMAVEVEEEVPSEEVVVTKQVSEVSVAKEETIDQQAAVKIPATLPEAEDVEAEITIPERQRPATTVVSKKDESITEEATDVAFTRKVTKDEVDIGVTHKAEETEVTMKAPVSRKVVEEAVAEEAFEISESITTTKEELKQEELLVSKRIPVKERATAEEQEIQAAVTLRKEKPAEEEAMEATFTSGVVDTKTAEVSVTREEEVKKITEEKTEHVIGAKLLKATEEELPKEKTEIGADIFLPILRMQFQIHFYLLISFSF